MNDMDLHLRSVVVLGKLRDDLNAEPVRPAAGNPLGYFSHHGPSAKHRPGPVLRAVIERPSGVGGRVFQL